MPEYTSIPTVLAAGPSLLADKDTGALLLTTGSPGDTYTEVPLTLAAGPGLLVNQNGALLVIGNGDKGEKGDTGAAGAAGADGQPLESYLYGHVWYVAPAASGGSDAAAGTVDAPFLTPEHAVAVAASGDMIVVRAGTYALAAVLNLATKNLHVIGAGMGLTILTGADNTPLGGLVVLGGYSVAEGLTAHNTDTTQYSAAFGMSDSGNAAIRNCEAIGQTGVGFAGCHTANVSGCLITGKDAAFGLALSGSVMTVDDCSCFCQGFAGDVTSVGVLDLGSDSSTVSFRNSRLNIAVPAGVAIGAQIISPITVIFDGCNILVESAKANGGGAVATGVQASDGVVFVKDGIVSASAIATVPGTSTAVDLDQSATAVGWRHALAYTTHSGTWTQA